MRYRKQRNYGCRIHDQYIYQGMRTLTLENDLVRVSLLLDKGADIYEYLFKPTDMDFVWLSERGIQNPMDYLSTSADPDAVFLDYYLGGWQEVIPNGGPLTRYLGASYGQHGEAAQMPWDYEILEDTPNQVTVQLSVELKKIPFQLQKTFTLVKGDTTLSISEQLVNMSPVPLQYMWGQHLTFGPPFLSAGCRITLPDGIAVLTESADSEVAKPERVQRGRDYHWPMACGVSGDTLDLSVVPELEGTSDILYLTGFGEHAFYQVENPDQGLGVHVTWDGATCPYLWYWQEFGGTRSYPWYGRHYNIGLEPFSSRPTHGLNEAIRNGTARAIGPFETSSFSMKIKPYVI